jgi:riboflavin synthase
MFTGIIEEIGAVDAINSQGRHRRISVKCAKILADLNTGDSVAMDGVCLTVEEVSKTGFSAFASPETLERSTLKNARPGLPVNLERALILSGRLGGHLVQGHVDTVGTILRDNQEGGSLARTIALDEAYMKYTAEKGSIAVDGVSLTVASRGNRDITVVLIPETLKRTTLLSKKTGGKVNIETDILAKYTESLLKSDGIALTESKLREHGF